jgi:hypothetical protein
MGLLSELVEWFGVDSYSKQTAETTKTINARFNRRSVLSQLGRTMDQRKFEEIQRQGDAASAKWIVK